MTPTFNEFVAGRSVALIGNSPHVSNPEPRVDIVVRCNCAKGRTDVLFWDGPESDPPSMEGIKYLFLNPFRDDSRVLGVRAQLWGVPVEYYSHPPKGDQCKWADAPIFQSSARWMRKYNMEHSKRPLTGFFALWRIMDAAPKYVRVGGFTFYEEGGISPQWVGSHNMSEHQRILLDMCRDHPNIILEQEVVAVLLRAIEAENSTEPRETFSLFRGKDGQMERKNISVPGDEKEAA
jgi:hypothetical protein